MKTLAPALLAHLDEGTTTLAWCWRISRADGVTFGFTDHDRTLTFDGTDFELKVRRATTKQAGGYPHRLTHHSIITRSTV